MLARGATGHLEVQRPNSEMSNLQSTKRNGKRLLTFCLVTILTYNIMLNVAYLYYAKCCLQTSVLVSLGRNRVLSFLSFQIPSIVTSKLKLQQK